MHQPQPQHSLAPHALDPAAWRSLMRDALLLYLLTFWSGVVLGLSGFAPTQANVPLFLLVSNILLVIGFGIAGVVTPYQRWHYLPAVAMLLWLMCLVNVPMGFDSVGSWFLSSISYLINVAIGGGISHLITRLTKPAPVQPEHHPA